MPIDTERHGHTLLVRINRPEAMNALDVDAMVDLNNALTEFRDDADLRVAVITGEGGKAFCAGADLKKTTTSEAGFAEAHYSAYDVSVRNGLYVRAIRLDLLNLTKPLIAAVNGHALGAGAEISLACDLRIASSGATFGFPEARWATVPAIGGVSRLLRAVPRAVAMQMLLTGDRIDAREAYRVGLVSELVEPNELVHRALELAARIADNGPLAVQSITELARHSEELTLSRSLDLEEIRWGLLRDTHDRAEGRAAFAERRTPTYEGR